MAYITHINTSLRIDYKQHELKKLFKKKTEATKRESATVTEATEREREY